MKSDLLYLYKAVKDLLEALLLASPPIANCWLKAIYIYIINCRGCLFMIRSIPQDFVIQSTDSRIECDFFYFGTV